MTIGSNQQIFWFQVSVCDLSFVKVLESQCDFSDIKQCDIVWEYIFFSKQSEYFTTLNEVENQVEVKFILECLN